MQIKEVKPSNFLFFRTETTVTGLKDLLPVGQELFREAVGQNIWIGGGVQWHYFGFQGDESKPFTLEIALPVASVLPEYDGKFHFKRTEPFKCVSLFHEGSWLEIPHSYQKLMEFIAKNELTPVAINREVYVNADFKHPEANITEIQVGIL
jgi:effector-binding domain-containing protein